MTPENPTQTHARFLAVVQRAYARPLHDCTPAPVYLNPHVTTAGRVQPVKVKN